MKATGYDTNKLVLNFNEKGIKINGEENGEMRFVTNYWVTKDNIDYVVQTMKELLK